MGDKTTLATALKALNAKALATGMPTDEYSDEYAEIIDAHDKTGVVVVTGGSSAGTYPVT